MHWTRRITFAVIALAIAAGLAYGFWPEPQAVETAVVHRGPLEETIESEGRTRVKDRFVISAPVTSYAQRLPFDVGDTVRRGETLVTLEPLRAEPLTARAQAEAEARVSAARAAVEAARHQAAAAEAEAKLAESDLQRLEALSKAQFVSRDRLEAARARVLTATANARSAEFSVTVARYQLDAARTALTYAAQSGAERLVAVTAPVAGQVLKVNHQSEGVVPAGGPLVELGDARSLEVAVDVLSADAVKIQAGMPVSFERWGGGEELRGRVRMVEPVAFTKVSALGVEEQRVWVISDFTSDPSQWSRLGDGYRVEARFILWRGEDVLKVPVSALFHAGGRWAVFAAVNGRARLTSVTLGRQSGTEAQVLNGLAAGARVIIHPDESISDGTRISYRR